jgi:hypothetical protein
MGCCKAAENWELEGDSPLGTSLTYCNTIPANKIQKKQNKDSAVCVPLWKLHKQEVHIRETLEDYHAHC